MRRFRSPPTIQDCKTTLCCRQIYLQRSSWHWRNKPYSNVLRMPKLTTNKDQLINRRQIFSLGMTRSKVANMYCWMNTSHRRKWFCLATERYELYKHLSLLYRQIHSDPAKNNIGLLTINSINKMSLPLPVAPIWHKEAQISPPWWHFACSLSYNKGYLLEVECSPSPIISKNLMLTLSFFLLAMTTRTRISSS